MKTQSFGYKNAWLCAKSVTPAALAKGLSLRNTSRCEWADGVEAAYQDAVTPSVFITPPIDGWVLGVGLPLLELAASRPPTFGHYAAELAERLQTEVQYFATHRIVEAHAWARAHPAGLERAYLYVGESGEKLADVGAKTAEELALGFAFSDAEAESSDLACVGEEHVMMLAARWSVDPSGLTERALEVDQGLVGEFRPPRGPVEAIRVLGKPWWKLW